MHTKNISVGGGKTKKWAATAKASTRENITLLDVIRGRLELADNTSEVKKILQKGLVQVDGKTVKEANLGVGLMSVVSIPKIKKHYRILTSDKGLTVREIPSKEAELKLCRVNGKKTISGGKTQLSLHDGSTILYDKECAVNDTLVLQLPQREVSKRIPLKAGAQVLVYWGRHSGTIGEISEVIAGTQSRKSLSKVGGSQTLTDYVFVVGDKKPEITI
ncbi:MAG TPA: hypothetical protein ENN13_01560 [Candidatus Altiarchaeales archaeon]|nr:hypothetical protein [Candidatus Altiarchaeales archaeon]